MHLVGINPDNLSPGPAAGVPQSELDYIRQIAENAGPGYPKLTVLALLKEIERLKKGTM